MIQSGTPRRSGAADIGLDDARSADPATKPATRVMIVEDELIIALDLEDVLVAAGYEVVGVAADMHQAIDIAEANRPDIAIMDVNLARGTNGVETAFRLRERFNVPSLFVSGNLDAKMRTSAAKCRPLGFVPKPCRHEDLLSYMAGAAAGGSNPPRASA